LTWRGFVESDLRLFVTDMDVPVERLETTAGVKTKGKFGEHVRFLADLNIIFDERSNPQNFAGLTNRALLDPWRIESAGLFVEFVDMGLDGLDLRLGRQQVIWGTADRFHPSSNLNPLDVEDPLRFGETIANEMVTLRYSPDLWLGYEDEAWFEELSFEFVFVPVFKPAQLPNSSGLAFTDPAELERQAKSKELKELLAAQKLLSDTLTFSYSPFVAQPDRNLKNSMMGARMAWNLFAMDMSVSYFRGFDDFPRAEKVVAVQDGTHVDSQIKLTYPRIQVLGADIATSLDWLGGLGVWFEGAMVMHNDLYRLIDTGPILNKTVLETEHKKGRFFKMTAGMDYSPTPTMYLNVQYLHGFLDEFGAANLDDYIVAGIDIKMARDTVLFRTFGIVNLQDQSFVAFPQLIFMPWNNAELTVGTFLFFGKDDSKFGSVVAGSSTAFMKAKVIF
jgi:hypothetical protein